MHILTINCSEYLLMDGTFQLTCLYLEQHQKNQTQRWNSYPSVELTEILDTQSGRIVHRHLLWMEHLLLMEHILSAEQDQPVLQHL